MKGLYIMHLNIPASIYLFRVKMEILEHCVKQIDHSIASSPMKVTEPCVLESELSYDPLHYMRKVPFLKSNKGN